jgi:hypothetical protein
MIALVNIFSNFEWLKKWGSLQQTFKGGETFVVIGNNLSVGMYLVRVKTKSNVYSGKIIKIE